MTSSTLESPDCDSSTRCVFNMKSGGFGRLETEILTPVRKLGGLWQLD